MPVTIGDLTTDVIAETEQTAAAAAGPPEQPENDAAVIRARLAAIAGQAMRTRAEGFDD